MKKENFQTAVFLIAVFATIAAVAAILIATGALTGGAYLFAGS